MHISEIPYAGTHPALVTRPINDGDPRLGVFVVAPLADGGTSRVATYILDESAPCTHGLGGNVSDFRTTSTRPYDCGGGMDAEYQEYRQRHGDGCWYREPCAVCTQQIECGETRVRLWTLTPRLGSFYQSGMSVVVHVSCVANDGWV